MSSCFWRWLWLTHSPAVYTTPSMKNRWGLSSHLCWKGLFCLQQAICTPHFACSSVPMQSQRENPRISLHVFVCDAAKEPTVFCFFSTKPWVFFLFSLLVCELLNTFASSCGQISIIHVHTGDYNDTRSLQTDKPAPQFIRDLSFSLQTRECPLFSRKRAKTLQSSLSSPG